MSNTEIQRRPIIVIPPSPRNRSRPAKHKRNYRGPRPFALLLLALVLIALAHLLIVTHQPSTPASATATNCAGLMRTADYTQSVHLQPDSEQLAAVEFVNQLDDGQPASLAQVTHNDAQHTLDVYVFGCVMRGKKPQLTTLFAQSGLLQGTVEISKANTLITSTLDTTITADASAFLLPLQQNIYREYAWQNDAFHRVAFPALYPVTSRVEAEALQQDADSGQTLPWNDPLAAAEELSKDVFKWPVVDARDTALSNDGVTAQVELFQSNANMIVNVTLQRLLQHDNKGLWFVVAAHTNGITLGLAGQQRTTLPQNISTSTMLHSPIQLSGASALADGSTSATLFDHTLTAITSVTTIPLQVSADGTYTGALNYGGIIADQQGLLLIQSTPLAANNQVESGQLLLVPALLG
ncbi:MAG: hypothetical protein ACRDIV_23950 [Ktedonobacteraceae bacterium]